MAPHHESFLVDAKGAHVSVDRDVVAAHLEAGEFFWLDLHKPTAADIAMLGEVFAFHPLAVEDASHFGQRPKYDTFDQFAYLVVYGTERGQGRPRRGALLLQWRLPRHSAPRHLPDLR